VLTHAHWDHVSGLPDLPGVPVWVTQQELDFIHSGKFMATLIASFKDINYRVYGFDHGPYLGFAHSYDVFGDGSVVIVPAAGHTPGSVIAFITTPDAKRYALIGDIAWQKESIAIPAQRPWLPRLMVDEDADSNRALIIKLHELQQTMPDLIMVPAHDRRVWQGLPALKNH
ncbi:MAG: MBL fold metallo-hydrolase, partial [Nevskiales bacterium]